MRTLSNVRVRNVATIGGSLAHADPHMDLPPVLIALGAQWSRSQGPPGERTIPVEELFAGYYETVLARNELITERHRSGARRPPRGLSQMHDARGARLAGARRRGRRSTSDGSDRARRARGGQRSDRDADAACRAPSRRCAAATARRRALAAGGRSRGRRGRD